MASTIEPDFALTGGSRYGSNGSTGASATDPDISQRRGRWCIDLYLVTRVSSGTLTGEPPNYTYMPAEGFTGTGTFRYKANDGKTDGNTATVTILVGVIVNIPDARLRAKLKGIEEVVDVYKVLIESVGFSTPV